MKCKVCSSPVVKLTDTNLHMLVPEKYPLKGELELAVCNSCGFVFNDSASGEPDYTNYYKELNKHHKREGALKDIDINYFGQLLDFIENTSNFKISNSDVLDYGSGALLFSELVKSKGAKSAINYDIGKPKISDNFDLVISTHCFEHIFDPYAAFEHLVEHMADDGHVCVAVPDLERYQEAYYGPYAHFDLEHINHFSLSSLKKLFELNGLEVLATRHSDRMVTSTLAYSEILILGRKSISDKKPSSSGDREFSALDTARSLLERSSSDMEIMLGVFKEILADKKRVGDSIIGIYGLSSYAFRFLHVLKQNEYFKYIDFLADSDRRISKYSLEGHQIFDKPSFSMYLHTHLEQGKSVYVVIAAINGFRIKQMFDEEYGTNGIKVSLLPPDCQNRNS